MTYTANPKHPLSKPICKNGHDKRIVGVAGKSRMCMKCKSKWHARFLTSHPDKRKRSYRQKEYKEKGLCNVDGSQFTLVDYDRAYQIQQGRCAICKKHQSELPIALSADHDHKSNKFRALLCNRCNFYVGWAENEKVSIAKNYLEEYKVRNALNNNHKIV